MNGKLTRLEILQNSLNKKQNIVDHKIQEHINTVRSANGQPLNDKRNGAATLNKWDKQNVSIKNAISNVETTKNAIETEKLKVSNVELANEYIPNAIHELVKSGEVIQWRKHPDYFFVVGVDKARIHFIKETGSIAHRYLSAVVDKDQYKKFAAVYNSLKKSLNHHAQQK